MPALTQGLRSATGPPTDCLQLKKDHRTCFCPKNTLNYFNNVAHDIPSWFPHRDLSFESVEKLQNLQVKKAQLYATYKQCVCLYINKICKLTIMT